MVWYLKKPTHLGTGLLNLVGLTMVGDVSNFYQVGHCFLTCYLIYLIQLIHVLITYQYIASFLLLGRHRGMVPKNVVNKIKKKASPNTPPFV